MRYVLGDRDEKIRRKGAYPQQAAIRRLIVPSCATSTTQKYLISIGTTEMIRACARLFIASGQIIFCLATSTIVLSFDS
jgi:hypothetical protein